MKKLQIKYLNPNPESKKVEGMMCYHESTQAWVKIIFKSEILELCKELRDKHKKFGYELEYPITDDEKKRIIQELINNPDSWPMMLRFKEVNEREVKNE